VVGQHNASWDKTIKQRWFDGWKSTESFDAVPKAGKEGKLDELLRQHRHFTQDEIDSLAKSIRITQK